MLRDLKLDFGTHSLLFTRGFMHVRGELCLRKDNGTQDIKFRMPQMPIEVIQQAWRDQGEKWDDLIPRSPNASPFLAVRALWLPEGCILWNVLHIDNKPFDTCGYVELTKQIVEASRLRDLQIAIAV